VTTSNKSPKEGFSTISIYLCVPPLKHVRVTLEITAVKLLTSPRAGIPIIEGLKDPRKRS